MKINILGYILIAFVLIIAYRIFQESEYLNLKCIISEVDGKRYCVRERSKLTLAADLLATINLKMNELVKYVGEKYPDRENVKRLVKGYNPKKISETLPTSEYTAYSENKGEKIAFCLNTEKKKGSRMIDENTLMFVALHELSHVATKSIGHTEEFWNNFKFLLKEADKIKIYKPEDYKKNSKRYCGTSIVDNPYFDL
jgi:predicted metal-dependent hydrolase|tara:strand:- start:1467 stop:2060 length:594 start_codon:yes stop_codon:yes gene_type:complete